jgi:carboxymethylenebutenolidase
MKKKHVSEIATSTVRLSGGLSAFRALPKAKGRRPAVILLHERYGIVRHTKDLIVKFARAGFVALAPDLFWRFTGDKKALERGDGRCEMRDGEALEDIGRAIEYLKRLRSVDPSRIAVMGVCQTGRQAVLPAGRDDVAACVVFYGAAGGKEWTTDEFRPTPLESLLQKVSCPVLGVFGEADHIISIDDVLRFRAALEQGKKSYHIRIYPDAPHGWLNDTMPGRYRKEAANDAWKLLLDFLKKSRRDDAGKDKISWKFESGFSAGYDFKKNVRME